MKTVLAIVALSVGIVGIASGQMKDPMQGPTQPDGSSAYERMLVKYTADVKEHLNCSMASLKQNNIEMNAWVNASISMVQNARWASDITAGPPMPVAAACDDSKVNADVMWLTVNDPPAGVERYVAPCVTKHWNESTKKFDCSAPAKS